MSLVDRLASIEDRRKTRLGCETCRWLGRRTEDELQAIDEWLTEGYSLRQLHLVLTTEENDPYPLSESAFKNHLRNCTRPAE